MCLMQIFALISGALALRGRAPGAPVGALSRKKKSRFKVVITMGEDVLVRDILKQLETPIFVVKSIQKDDR